jgi:hypothetical protein
LYGLANPRKGLDLPLAPILLLRLTVVVLFVLIIHCQMYSKHRLRNLLRSATGEVALKG